ncbi:translation initiation factor 2 [Desulfovibrio sp. ZJ200]|uniref:translation initiation factor 2 n=1 Tax=Desulfovibrio sp. ZJ200 TaxID=2709792 RepID=UPI0013EBD236|nr:translation initiation factor 2 [Desulfovibrio sp. ZJ200]
MKIYIAASFRQLHAVQLLQRSLALELPDIQILDWTGLAMPPADLTPAQRRQWMDTDHGGEVFAFCEEACGRADLLIYVGQSGQDAGVEVGLARAAGVPVLGILGPLEAPGLMLYGAVTLWTRTVEDACERIATLVSCPWRASPQAQWCASCPSEKICNMAPTMPDLAQPPAQARRQAGPGGTSREGKNHEQ